MATTRHPTQRNAIGAHSGSYCVYKVRGACAALPSPSQVLLLVGIFHIFAGAAGLDWMPWKVQVSSRSFLLFALCYLAPLRLVVNVGII